MTERQKEAIEYIEGQLEYGYIDLGTHDRYEIEIIREAINMWKTIDEFNSIGCTSFQIGKINREQELFGDEDEEEV